jgi:hypothetical protein
VVKSTNVLNEVYEDRLTSCRLWPVRSPVLNPCDLYDFYLWQNIKRKVYSHNSYTFDELYHSICETVTSVKVSKLELVSNNLVRRLEAVLRAEESTLSIFSDSEFFEQFIYCRNECLL